MLVWLKILSYRVIVSFHASANLGIKIRNLIFYCSHVYFCSKFILVSFIKKYWFEMPNVFKCIVICLLDLLVFCLFLFVFVILRSPVKLWWVSIQTCTVRCWPASFCFCSSFINKYVARETSWTIIFNSVTDKRLQVHVLFGTVHLLVIGFSF